jgi:hypothetical protein
MMGMAAGFYHGNVKELIEDIAELKPTIFIGVPRVYQRIQQVASVLLVLLVLLLLYCECYCTTSATSTTIVGA